MSQIKSGKWVIKEVFKQWYRVPNYQRPYVWEKDQVVDLLDDISSACEKDSSSEYFLGSLVLKENKRDGYTEYDVLDGQQRLTTLFLLTAVIRDITDNPQRKKTCDESIFQQGNEDDNIPERLRIIFDIRDEVKEFITENITPQDGTNPEKIKKLANKQDCDKSIYNMTNAIVNMQNYFTEKNKEFLDKFFKFLRNNVILIYVASEDLNDAFRMFTVLNNRGVKLRNADILKADNLSVIENSEEQRKYAKNWETIENYFGEEFDSFLSHLQSILTKQKAQFNLLKEFEQNIFEQGKLKKGNDFFDFIQKYKKNYEDLFDNNDNLEIANLLTLMKLGFESEIWIAPLLCYYDKFKTDGLLDFTKRLNNKFVSDWISGLTPTIRIGNMNAITDEIEKSSALKDLFGKDCFTINKDEIKAFLTGNVYGKRSARYILLLLNYLYHSDQQQFTLPKTISIEHILPQNPEDNSQWKIDFTDEQRSEWANKLGNLIILSRRKNSSQSNSDFAKKKEKYFKGKVELGRSASIMAYPTWTMTDLQKNHEEVLAKLKTYFEITE